MDTENGPKTGQITPEYVDKLMDKAGRAAVASRLLVSGWTTGNPPPLWVVHAAAMEILAEKA